MVGDNFIYTFTRSVRLFTRGISSYDVGMSKIPVRIMYPNRDIRDAHVQSMVGRVRES